MTGAAPVWPPRAQPEPWEKARIMGLAEARQARGLAHELAADLGALAQWARPSIAAEARTLQRALLQGPTLAEPGLRAKYEAVWLKALEPAPELGLDVRDWDDAAREIVRDAVAEAELAGSKIVSAVAWTAAAAGAGLLIYLAAKD